MADIRSIAKQIKENTIPLPVNRVQLEEALCILINQVFFPSVKSQIEDIEIHLSSFKDILLRNLNLILQDETRAEMVMDNILNKLPSIHSRLLVDAKVFHGNDPASNCQEEVILSYPGFFAITVYRIAHELVKLDIPIIPRIFSEYAHSKVGIDINPCAQIGNSFYIDHGTGIVIGESTVIGNNVRIYQGVTLGAMFVTKELSQQKRHPTIEDNVVIYAGATILGGDTIIGHDSVIGGNAWLTNSVPPHSMVIQKAKIVIRNSQKEEEEEYI